MKKHKDLSDMKYGDDGIIYTPYWNNLYPIYSSTSVDKKKCF